GPQATVLNHGETIASKFANNYHEISPADANGYSAFLELGLVLFVITVLINGLARWVVARSTPEMGPHKTLFAKAGKSAEFFALPCFSAAAQPLHYPRRLVSACPLGGCISRGKGVEICRPPLFPPRFSFPPGSIAALSHRHRLLHAKPFRPGVARGDHPPGAD